MIIGAATWLLTALVHGLIIGGLSALTIPTLSRRPRVRVVLWRLALGAPFVTSTIAVGADAIAPRQTIDVVARLRPQLPLAWRREEVRVLEDQRLGGPLVRNTIVDDRLAQATAWTLCVVALVSAVAGVGLAVRSRRRSIAALGPREPLSVGAGSLHVSCLLRGSLGEHSISYSGSARLLSPIALGRNEICLPIPAFADLEAAEQHSVLLHEVAHLERRDPLWLDLSQLVAALTPWRPLGGRVLRALRHDTELAADERAIELGAEPMALVAALARFSGMIERERAQLGVALTVDESRVVERGRRILEIRAGLRGPAIARSPKSTVGAWLLVTAAAGALIGLPLPTPADREAVRRFGNPRETLRVQQLLETPPRPLVTEPQSHARPPIRPSLHRPSSP